MIALWCVEVQACSRILLLF